MTTQQESATVFGYYQRTIFRQLLLDDVNVLIIGHGFVGNALSRVVPDCHVLTRQEMMCGKNRAAERCFTEKHTINKNLDVLLFQDFSNEGLSQYLWSSIVRKYDVVINVIANTDTRSGCSLYGSQVETMVNTNYTLPLIVARACQEMNIVFVNISTACLLPDNRDGRLIGSHDVEQAEAPYYATKMLTDSALRNMDCVVTVRPRLIYDNVSNVDQRVRTNLTHRIQDYPKVYDCRQSFTHRWTLCAAIIHLVRYRLDSTVVSSDETYNVTDAGLASLDQLSANPDVEVVPCEQTIGSFSPIRIIQADISKLLSTGFRPIDVNWGTKEAQISAACWRNSNN